MFTYFLLTLPFIGLTMLLDVVILRTRVICRRQTWYLLLIMLGFTAVFDQLFTGLPIVLYNFSLTTGIKFFYAPIEDFSYTIAAVIGIGSLASYVQRQAKKDA